MVPAAASLESLRARYSLYDTGSVRFALDFKRETVLEKVDVLAMEAASTSFAGWVGFSLGDAGWNQVGGWSSGNPVCSLENN